MNERYSRQVLFQPIGTKGQNLIRQKHVMIIGLGALGSSIAEMLTRAGIGQLTMIDRDYVDWSNLGRQQLYEEEDAELHLPKAIAAKQRLKKLNSDVVIHAHVMEATANDLEEFAQHNIDIMLDATDNFDIRMIINDVAQKWDIPWIYGACVGSYGMSYTIIPGETPCLQCLLNTVPLNGPTCDTAGIISPVVQLVTAHQVAEALKLLVGDHAALRKELVAFNLWENRYQSLTIDHLKQSDCPTCGVQRTYPYLIQDTEVKTEALCGRDTVQIRPYQRIERDLSLLEQQLKRQNGVVKRNNYLLAYSTNTHRLVFFHDGRVLVHGTNNVAEASKLYKKLIE
ncbi:MoeB/ThiF family adenylyltransferase [Jeotgalibacillus soli]|uniref:UBA/THIF-type NAD/FAD binding protein n=1 Tax=Jeotgalibacillus soli TaxID=889306 RepID=A0A0C2W7R8_9BACL|nr:MoeB/ThiF family adenylyltransferase [Jeotgalibacillus soli]KIL52058.1 UBA/THIF-type NAD/FAD binding protein [Jeotgalibacillus soli]